MHLQETTALDVIAAVLALPFVERELNRWRDEPAWGDNSVADAARIKHAEKRKPLIARRDELLAVILGSEPS